MTTRKPRPWGTGSIYVERGRYRARLPGRHGRRNLDGSFSSALEAEAALAAALEMLAARPLDAPTLGSFGETWLADGIRDVRASVLARDRLRWSAYVEDAPIAQLPIVEIAPADVETWLRDLRGTRRAKLAAQTRQNALSLLRSALEAARARGGPLYGQPNPAAEITLGRRERERTAERWTWLRAPEIARVLAAPLAPKPRAAITVAIYTGLRAGELWGLTWPDVDFTRRVLAVRHSRGEATKGGAPREVPLLAPALDALRTWRALSERAGVRSHLDLVFPAPHGGHHSEGYDAGWSALADELGIGRATFHDLRHTAASHLLMGTWAPAHMARALRLEEVRAWLGHRSLKTTERYAHLAPESIAALVRAPGRGRKRPAIRVRTAALARRTGTQIGTQIQAASGIRTPDLRFTKPDAPTGNDAGNPSIPPDASRVASRLRRAAERAADALVRSDPHRDHRAAELIEAAADALAILEAPRRAAQLAPAELPRPSRRPR